MVTGQIGEILVRALHELYDMYKQGGLEIPSMHSRSEKWSPWYQSDFIGTVLRGFPIPEIYIAKKSTDPQTGKSIYTVVDGRERLMTLFDYVSGKGVIMYTGEVPRFSYLDNQKKKMVFNYCLVVRDLGEMSQAPIKEIFSRLTK